LHIRPSPACGSDNISFKKLSGNDWDGWDPPWIYTPLRESLRGSLQFDSSRIIRA